MLTTVIATSFWASMVVNVFNAITNKMTSTVPSPPPPPPPPAPVCAEPASSNMMLTCLVIIVYTLLVMAATASTTLFITDRPTAIRRAVAIVADLPAKLYVYIHQMLAKLGGYFEIVRVMTMRGIAIVGAFVMLAWYPTRDFIMRNLANMSDLGDRLRVQARGMLDYLRAVLVQLRTKTLDMLGGLRGKYNALLEKMKFEENAPEKDWVKVD